MPNRTASVPASTNGDAGTGRAQKSILFRNRNMQLALLLILPL
ncbi:MAG: hypothetical protein RLZZ330_1089, partial [Actinomycetota bacterium]